MSAVGCCGQPPCVVVATARCLVPTAQHSTAQHSLSLAYFPSPWRRLVWAPPARACTRTTALHLAHLGAGKRTGAQCGAAEAQCRHLHPPHHPATATHWHHTHTHNFHYLLTFIGRGARWEHSGWFCSLLGAVDGSISRIRSIRNMQPTFGEGDLKWSELYLL